MRLLKHHRSIVLVTFITRVFLHGFSSLSFKLWIIVALGFIKAHFSSPTFCTERALSFSLSCHQFFKAESIKTGDRSHNTWNEMDKDWGTSCCITVISRLFMSWWVRIRVLRHQKSPHSLYCWPDRFVLANSNSLYYLFSVDRKDWPFYEILLKSILVHLSRSNRRGRKL